MTRETVPPRCDSCGQPLGSWDIDRLTGVLNRWGWDERAPRTLGLALTYAQPVALAIIDLDAFKSVNDLCGHLAGDAVLSSVAVALRENTRGSDLVARFGGDEFVLLLPGSHVDSALTLARHIQDKLRKIAVGDSSIGDGSTPGCSATIGIALADPVDSVKADIESLFMEADRALLAAKRRGGNRISYVMPRAEAGHDRVAELHVLPEHSSGAAGTA